MESCREAWRDKENRRLIHNPHFHLRAWFSSLTPSSYHFYTMTDSTMIYTALNATILSSVPFYVISPLCCFSQCSYHHNHQHHHCIIIILTSDKMLEGSVLYMLLACELWWSKQWNGDWIILNTLVKKKKANTSKTRIKEIPLHLCGKSSFEKSALFIQHRYREVTITILSFSHHHHENQHHQ